MRYINQLEYPHWPYVTRTDMDGEDCTYGATTTVKSSGCGLCTAVMTVDRLLPNSDFDLSAAVSLSYACKANHQIGTDYLRYAPALAEQLGLRLEMSWKMEDLLACLRTGGAAVALVGVDEEDRVGLFTYKKHYISVINEEPDGRVAILDPSLAETKFDIEGRRGKVEIRNGAVVLCTTETLAEEAATWKVPYYLFWRK